MSTMRFKFVAVLLGGLLAVALIAVPASAGGGHDRNGPNQGDPDKVLKVDNEDVWCEYPVPGKKVEGGNLGRKIFIRSWKPIDFVTVKSGKDAYVVFSKFGEKYGKFWAVIKLSKDVSNFVVWTCPEKKYR